MARNQNALIWSYFTRNAEDRIADCNYCSKTLSYRTTITNLKQHMKSVHGSVYQDYLKKAEGEDGGKSNDEDSEDSTPQDEIWGYYEKETGGRARCVVCRAAVANRPAALKKHLKNNHGKLVAELNLQESDEETPDTSNQDDVYTEVVYLEQSPKKKTEKLERKKERKIEKRKRLSTSSEDEPILKVKKDEEVEQFGKYITVLLKKLPSEVCTKLQLEIVSLIMKEKLNSSQNESVYAPRPAIPSTQVSQNTYTILDAVNTNNGYSLTSLGDANK